MRGIKCGTFRRLCLRQRPYTKWSDFCRAELEMALQTAPEIEEEIGRALTETVIGFVARQERVLDDAQAPSLVHNDFWPGNMLIDVDCVGNLLDFEFAISGPADANLFKLELFCREPEAFGHPGDYSELWDRLVHAQPDLIAVPHLRARFDVCEILFALRSRVLMFEASAKDIALTRARVEKVIGRETGRLA
jgi:hypothetical protein